MIPRKTTATLQQLQQIVFADSKFICTFAVANNICMRTRNRIYNALILREKYPHLFRCDRISYSAHSDAGYALLHTELRCVGRVCCFITSEAKRSFMI